MKNGPNQYHITYNNYDIDNMYVKLDEYHQTLEVLREKGSQFNELEELFDIEPSKFKLLHECRLDITKLKKFTDILSYIQTSYDQWMVTPWKNIVCEYYYQQNDIFNSTAK